MHSHEPFAERPHEMAVDARDAAPVNAAAEQSPDWQAHWIDSHERAAPSGAREPREVRERPPEQSYAPEPSHPAAAAERADFTRAETNVHTEPPAYRPEPPPQREPEPPRPERSAAPHDEPRPPPDTVN